MDIVEIRNLTDQELLDRSVQLAAQSRENVADLVDVLAEIDRRKLGPNDVYGSLHEYCVHKLLLPDGSAYRHIRAARSIQKFPPIGPALRSGRLTLETIALIHPYIEGPDGASLVAAALGKSVSEVERLIAPRRTEAPRKDVVRVIAAASPPPAAETAEMLLPKVEYLPTPEAPRDDSATPTKEPEPTSLPAASGKRFASRMDIYAAPAAGPSLPARHAVRIGFTADESFDQLLKEVQAAMRHKYPDGSLEGIFRDALRALLKKNRPWAFPRAVRARRG